MTRSAAADATSSTLTESTATEPTVRRVAARPERHNKVFVGLGLFVAFVLAGFVSGFASSSPDGLEKVAADQGFIHQEKSHSFADWPLAGYAVSGIDNERLAGGLAGVIGVSIAFVVGGAVFWGVTRLRPRAASAASERDQAAERTGAGPGAGAGGAPLA
ncbi:hypothetical protein CcI49_08420 [Frankia sp. CcI49]|uniref:PDGLE domain-containing protein n=1 Tax=unclassified Frankia TaxID=2632575 RepID=UPI0006CA0348|nr:MULTISPECIES: PDGLE domain-containing protein [unclassified Frankia]KPM54915.1 hypothetical protein ACG83_16145 [Frankia sp. R43]ONH61118.1 hypothetical protein CcI49_08420 [Frankia sp. CcI49]